MPDRKSEEIWQKIGREFVLDQALFSSRLNVLNDGLAKRLAILPGDSDRVINFVVISRSVITSTRWDALGAQDTDHLTYIVLIPKQS